MTSTTDSDERRDASPKPAADVQDAPADARDAHQDEREIPASDADAPAKEEAPAKENVLPEGTREDALDEDMFDEDVEDNDGKQPLSPSQARSLRMRVAGAFMAVAAVALVVRLSDQPSVLVIGIYGAALILCGIVIELSRRGRTRLGMWMLAGGLVAVAAADQWLRSG